MSKLFGWFSKNKQADKAKPEDKNTSDKHTTDAEQTPERESDKGSAQRSDAGEAEQQKRQQQEATPPSEAITPGAEQDADATAFTPTEEASAPAATSDADADIPEPDVSNQFAAREDEQPAPQKEADTTPEVSADVDEPDVSAQFAPKSGAGESAPEPAPQEKKKSLFSRLKAGLSRTRTNLGDGFVGLFKGKTIDDELYEELETQLLVADVGMDTTQTIIKELTQSATRRDLKDAEALLGILKSQMHGMLQSVEMPLTSAMEKHDPANGPFVILMVGVNGVGKTTTIGKLAKQFQQQGQKVMLAAGDTFRAAAVEQLQVWGERNSIPVIAQPTGSDSASVLYDALEAAKARKMDVLIADTAGRLQNKNNLMEELKKVVRVMKKINPDAPHEVMLTLDAGTGQNAVSQAKLFNEAVGLSGITLTKLDGTAKGGVIFSIADQFGIPIRYIGVGESIDDLRTFDSKEFIDALFSDVERATADT